jgi:hypothetical protein
MRDGLSPEGEQRVAQLRAARQPVGSAFCPHCSWEVVLTIVDPAQQWARFAVPGWASHELNDHCAAEHPGKPAWYYRMPLALFTGGAFKAMEEETHVV